MAFITLKFCGDETNVLGKIRCEISPEVSNFIPQNEFPLRFVINPLFSKEILYGVYLYPGTWAEWKPGRDCKATLYTNSYRVLKEYKYNYIDEDLKLFEFWDYFIRMNLNSTGLIIGAGSGDWGEWVQPVYDNKTICHLVEASKKQFEKLVANMAGNSNAHCYNDVVSVDGKQYRFFNDPDFHSALSSIDFDYVKNLIPGKLPEECIELRQTTKIKDLLDRIGKIDWIRFDVEGIDYDLIKAIDVEYLAKLKMVQYEHYALAQEKRNEIAELFGTLGFTKIEINIDTIFIKMSPSSNG
jgi:FkbM family methyltransferase